MSTSRYCSIYKAKNNKWYMDLAQEEHGEYEDSYTYGPFSSEQAVMDELETHSNPGAYDLDDSGTREVPTTSPNGKKIIGSQSERSFVAVSSDRFRKNRYAPIYSKKWR